MRIHAFPNYNSIPSREFVPVTVVVVNCMRTIPSYLNALTWGCDRIIPVESVEEAVAHLRQFPDAILGGDGGQGPIEEFHAGNSPREYAGFHMKDKFLIHYSGNGSRAITGVAAAERVYLGCLVNAGAVAARMVEEDPEELFFVCSGSRKQLGVLDLYALGGILDRMCILREDLELNDCAHLALALYRAHRQDPRSLFSGVRDYECLLSQDKAQDIEDCLREDTCPLVPRYSQGTVTIAQTTERETI